MERQNHVNIELARLLTNRLGSFCIPHVRRATLGWRTIATSRSDWWWPPPPRGGFPKGPPPNLLHSSGAPSRLNRFETRQEKMRLWGTSRKVERERRLFATTSLLTGLPYFPVVDSDLYFHFRPITSCLIIVGKTRVFTRTNVFITAIVARFSVNFVDVRNRAR